MERAIKILDIVKIFNVVIKNERKNKNKICSSSNWSQTEDNK